MSQSHLLIDFPIKGPANAKALAEELPPLMPDFADAQDDLGTVHFSRFMIKGDEKLLFLSDIDGEGDQHIERLVESAGSVFDAIFQHVDDAPATPVANDPQKVITWLKDHVREPLDTYFAYEDASVQDIKACARAAGFTGSTSQATLLTYMSVKSRREAFALKLVATRTVGSKGKEASDSLGTLHFSHWVAFEDNHLGFFTIFDGDFDEVHPGLRRQDLVRLRRALSTCRRRAAHPSGEERPGVLSVGVGKQLSADWVLQRVSRSRRSRRQSPAGRLSHVTIGHRWIAVALRHRLLDRRRHARLEAEGASTGRGRARARPCGHSGIRSPRVQDADVAALPVVGRRSGTSTQATRTARKRRRIRCAANHDRRGLARRVRARAGRQPRRSPRVASPTIASTSASPGPDWSRWSWRNAFRRSRSSRLARSSKEPRNARSSSEIRARAHPGTGSAALERGTITSS